MERNGYESAVTGMGPVSLGSDVAGAPAVAAKSGVTRQRMAIAFILSSSLSVFWRRGFGLGHTAALLQ